MASFGFSRAAAPINTDDCEVKVGGAVRPCRSPVEDTSTSYSCSNDDSLFSTRHTTSPGTPVKGSNHLRRGRMIKPLDDTVSTDSGDALSTSGTSDTSDNEEAGAAVPCGDVFSLHMMLLWRVAVSQRGHSKARVAMQHVQPNKNRTLDDLPATEPSRSSTGAWRCPGKENQHSPTRCNVPKLSASPTSWAAQQRRTNGCNVQAGPSDEDVCRSMKSILNKLTVEKFDALYNKLITCGISSATHVELLVSEIFEKATTQHHFIEMYADLCMRLDGWLNDSDTLASCKGGFRRILLNQCQSSFEVSLKPPAQIIDGAANEALMDAAVLHKRRMMGNIQLVGVLLVRGMLAPKILLSVAEELLRLPASAEALEMLAVLLKTVGSKFDDKSHPYYAHLSSVFDQVQHLTRDKAVAPRVRFLLRDVLDLRASAWVDDKCATRKAETPMRLEDVHRKASEEEAIPSPSNRTERSSHTSKKANTRFFERSDGGAVVKSKRNGTKAERASPGYKSRNATPSTQKNAPIVDGRLAVQLVMQPNDGASPAAALVHHETPTTTGARAMSTATLKGKQVALPISEAPTPVTAFNLKDFHYTLTNIMQELSVSRNTAGAVRRVQAECVPVQHHQSEFTNILTRIAEERCGAARRSAFAFAATLAGGAFNRDECAKGARSFFDEVYDDLCEEIPRLPTILKAELVPTLAQTFSAAQLAEVLPPQLQ